MVAALTDMTVRELMMSLSQVEDAIRQARFLPLGVADETTPSAAEDLAVLAGYEQRIVHELRRRRRTATCQAMNWYPLRARPATYVS